MSSPSVPGQGSAPFSIEMAAAAVPLNVYQHEVEVQNLNEMLRQYENPPLRTRPYAPPSARRGPLIDMAQTTTTQAGIKALSGQGQPSTSLEDDGSGYMANGMPCTYPVTGTPMQYHMGAQRPPHAYQACMDPSLLQSQSPMPRVALQSEFSFPGCPPFAGAPTVEDPSIDPSLRASTSFNAAHLPATPNAYPTTAPYMQANTGRAIKRPVRGPAAGLYPISSPRREAPRVRAVVPDGPAPAGSPSAPPAAGPSTPATTASSPEKTRGTKRTAQDLRDINRADKQRSRAKQLAEAVAAIEEKEKLRKENEELRAALQKKDKDTESQISSLKEKHDVELRETVTKLTNRFTDEIMSVKVELMSVMVELKNDVKALRDQLAQTGYSCPTSVYQRQP